MSIVQVWVFTFMPLRSNSPASRPLADLGGDGFIANRFVKVDLWATQKPVSPAVSLFSHKCNLETEATGRFQG